MMIFDTHAHLNDPRFDEDRDEVIRGCFDENIGLIVNIGCCLESSYDSVALAKQYPGVYAAVGVHPHSADEMTEESFAEIKALAKEEKVCAIGEIGLDYYYDNSERETQKYWFDRQLSYAAEIGMPVVIHNRDAHKDCMDILHRYDLKESSGVVHCFSGSVEIAREVLKMGLYISIGGALTFKNANRLLQVADAVPLSKILLETDCPYLTPEPLRGKRNDPRKTIYVAQKLAEIKNVSVDEVIKTTMQNGCDLFRIKNPMQ